MVIAILLVFLKNDSQNISSHRVLPASIMNVSSSDVVWRSAGCRIEARYMLGGKLLSCDTAKSTVINQYIYAPNAENNIFKYLMFLKFLF